MILASCQKQEKIEYYKDGNVMFRVGLSDSLYDGDYIEYYPDGKVKAKQFYIKGYRNGKAEWYHENGKIMLIEHWGNEVLVDTAKVYYDTGELEQITPYVNGKKNGEVKSFYKSGKINNIFPYVNGYMLGIEKDYYETGELQMVRKWIMFQGKSWPNGIVYYNSNGSIDSLDHIIELTSLKDTITLGDTYELNITLKGAYFKDIKVMIGNFDEEFNLLDSINVDTIPGKNYMATYRYKSYVPRGNVIRGKIEDYTVKFNVNGSTTTHNSYSYFEKKIYVKEARKL